MLKKRLKRLKLRQKKQKLLSKKTEETKEEVAQTAEETKTAEETTAVKEEVKEEVKATEFTFSDEALEKLVSNVAQQVAEKLLEQTNKEVAKVEDSINYDVLLQNNKQLTFDIDALSSLNSELTNKCKTVIISQILSLKGLKNDDKYAEVLAGRDLTSLTDTLQDLEYVTTKVSETTTQEVASEVKDSQQKVETEEKTAEEENLDKVTLSDSLNNLKEDTTKQQEAISNDLQILKDKGLAAYLRSRKDK